MAFCLRSSCWAVLTFALAVARGWVGVADASEAAVGIEARRIQIFQALDLDSDYKVTREEYFHTLPTTDEYTQLWVRPCSAGNESQCLCS